MILLENITRAFTHTAPLSDGKKSIWNYFRRERITKQALDGVSLQIPEGQIIGLMGANGAGKTTLIKICAGLVEKTSGHIRIGGFDPWARDPNYLKTLAVVMGQKAQLWWDIPAKDSLELIRRIYKIDKIKFQQRLTYFSERLGVQGVLKTALRKLSLGERMKCELIASLLHEPKIMLLDEPTIGLDFSSQKVIREVITEYRKSHQASIILTSHYMEDIKALCERVAIMRQGRIVYDGTLKNLTDQFGYKKTLEIFLTPGSSYLPETLVHLIPSLERDLTFDEKEEKISLVVPAVDTFSILNKLTSILSIRDVRIIEEDPSFLVDRIQKGEAL